MNTKALTNTPDSFKLRLPKSLYVELAKLAEEDGVSLNQYCIYLLSKNIEYPNLNKESINKLLLKIRHETKGNINNMFEEIQKLVDKVDSLKESLFYEIARVKGERGIPIQALKDLENNFPVLGGEVFGTPLPRLKMPSAKIVIEPNIDQCCDLESTLKGIVDLCQIALLTEIYVDEISDRRAIELPLDDTAIRSKVVYFLSSNFSDVQSNIEQMITALGNLSSKCKMNIRVEPTYVFIPIDNEFKKYLLVHNIL